MVLGPSRGGRLPAPRHRPGALRGPSGGGAGDARPGDASLALLGVLAGCGLAELALAAASAPLPALVALGALIALLLVPFAVAVSGSRLILVPAAAFAALGALVVAVLAVDRVPLVTLAVGGLAAALAAGLLALELLAPGRLERPRSIVSAAAGMPEVRQVVAGFLFGLAVTARLTIAFGFPFFVLVGGGGSWLRRAVLAAIGAALPVIGLLLYTYGSTGKLFNPAYDYLYQLELGYTFLNYHADWAITDLRYVPQNLGIMLFSLPQVLPDAIGNYATPVCVSHQARGLFDPACPLAVPQPVGMSLLLTSPAYLLAPFAFAAARPHRLDRLSVGAALAVIAIAFVNLTHFSQGWVQFGYRFSLDFAPFALVLVALGAARVNGRLLLAGLVAVSIVVNLWGTIWGVTLGW